MLTDKAETLSTVNPPPITVTLGNGESVTLKALTPWDFAEAEQWKRSRDMQAFLKATRTTPIPAEAYGQALARLAAKQYDFVDIAGSLEGKVYLIWRATDRVKPYDVFAKDLAPEEVARLGAIVDGLSGFAEEEEENPTTPLPATFRRSGDDS